MRNGFRIWNVTSFLCLVSLAGGIQAGEEKVPLDKLPSKIVDTIKKRYPGAELTEAVSEKDDDEIEYKVTIKVGGKKIEVIVEDDGELEGIEKEVDLKDLPKAVKDAIEAKFPKAILKSAEAIYEVKKNDEELEFYEVELTTADRKELELKVTAEGQFVDDEESEDDSSSLGWSDNFSSERDVLTSTGRNPFFILEAGYQLTLEDGKEQLVITVLNETKIVDGIECRVVEERETENGKLVEVSRNYFAISKRTGNIYYFGEDVDEYKDGKIASHKGSWLAGTDEARFGLMMPGLPLIGSRFYQEVAPKKAMDRAHVLRLDESLKTPAGEFKNCLKVEETSPLEPRVKEHKIYAPGIGLIRDGDLLLVKYGTVK